MTGATRVLIVDDSATVRAVLRRILSRAEGIELVGEACNGSEGVDAAQSLRPDVILMDVDMPVMDGFTATERIMELRPTPILVVTSRQEVQTAFEALRRGALEVIPKPETTAGWDALATNLPRAILAVSSTAVTIPTIVPTTVRPPSPARHIRVVAVGASTGGPAAIHTFLKDLPADAGFGVVIVQHIAAGFEDGLAEWLSGLGRWDVRVAPHDEKLLPGTVRIAPAAQHLRLDQDLWLRLDNEAPPRGGHRPSIDELFDSCARCCPHESVGILLTGMGRDGAAGLAEMHRAGAVTLVQDEASSVVFGMPRAALEIGAAKLALPPAELAAFVSRTCSGARS